MDPEFARAIARERTRARIAIGFIAAILVFEVVSIAFFAERAVVLQRIHDHQDVGAWAEASDTRVGIANLVTVFFQLPVAVMFLMWLHTAYGNLQRVGTGYTKQTPGWAVGYWFVPFLNIVRAYQIVKELCVRSADGNARADREGDPGPTTVVLWWTAYLVSTLVIRAGDSAGRADSGVEALIVSTWTLIAGTGIRVLAAALLISIVLLVDRRQAAFRPPDSQPAPAPPLPILPPAPA